MKFFTKAWYYGDMPDAEAERVPTAYRVHLAALAPKLPGDAFRLVNEVDLHDGLVLHTKLIDGTLELLLRTGNLAIGYFDISLHYGGAEISEVDKRFLKNAAGRRDVEILYDEVDESDNHWVHRIAFFPDYEEVTIRFMTLDLEIASVSNRFEGFASPNS